MAWLLPFRNSPAFRFFSSHINRGQEPNGWQGAAVSGMPFLCPPSPLADTAVPILTPRGWDSKVPTTLRCARLPPRSKQDHLLNVPIAIPAAHAERPRPPSPPRRRDSGRGVRAERSRLRALCCHLQGTAGLVPVPLRHCRLHRRDARPGALQDRTSSALPSPCTPKYDPLHEPTLGASSHCSALSGLGTFLGSGDPLLSLTKVHGGAQRPGWDGCSRGFCQLSSTVSCARCPCCRPPLPQPAAAPAGPEHGQRR